MKRFLLYILIFSQHIAYGQERNILAKVSIEIDGYCGTTSKLGFIDTLGNEIIAPTYNAYDFQNGWSNNLLAVNVGLRLSDHTNETLSYGKWGFVNSKGKETIPLKFKLVSKFRNGLAAVRTDKNWIIIDTVGNIILSLDTLQDCGYFENGLMNILRTDSTSYIDRWGKEVFRLKCDYGGPFYNGVARIFRAKKTDQANHVLEHGGYGLIDTLGKLLTDCNFSKIAHFSAGLAMVTISYEETALGRSEIKKYGFINLKGEIKIPVIYDFASNFSKDSIAVISILGDTLLGPKSNYRYGFININGHEFIKPQYLEVYNFRNGYAVVKNKQQQWGVIDKIGNTILEQKWKLLIPIDSNRFIAKRQGDSLVGLVDITGKALIPFNYPNLLYLGNNLFQVTNDSTTLLVDNKNKVWFKTMDYDFSDSPYLFGMIKVRDKITKKYGFINKKGAVMVPMKYSYIDDFEYTDY